MPHLNSVSRQIAKMFTAALAALFVSAAVPAAAYAQFNQATEGIKTFADALQGPIASAIIVLGFIIGGFCIMTNKSRGAQVCAVVFAGGLIIKFASELAALMGMV